MSQLFVCYSPKGEKFELTRANFRDCIQNYGFTQHPPKGVEAAPEPTPAPTPDPAPAPVAGDTANVDYVAMYGAMDKNDLKALIKSNWPDATFDGRASRDDLAALAARLTAEADEPVEDEGDEEGEGDNA
jgi:hypothetical protein